MGIWVFTSCLFFFNHYEQSFIKMQIIYILPNAFGQEFLVNISLGVDCWGMWPVYLLLN